MAQQWVEMNYDKKIIYKKNDNPQQAKMKIKIPCQKNLESKKKNIKKTTTQIVLKKCKK